MNRLDYLRNGNMDEENLSAPEPEDTVEFEGCLPGQTWEQAPALYAKLAQPHKYSFNYHYYEENLDKWIEEYERIYGSKYVEIQKKYSKLNLR